jgi:hypothetical protein
MNLSPLDVAFLGQLPITVRQDATAWAEALRDVAKPIRKSLEGLALRFGCDYATARRKYDLFRHSGYSVRVLVNCSKAGITRDALFNDALESDAVAKNEKFCAYAKQLAETNQRNSAAAHRLFCKQWRQGREIPGLDNSLRRDELPPGCSQDNFYRIVRDAFALEAMRKGQGSAMAKYGPQVFRTRVNLWYGSHYPIDDVWHDNFVVFGHERSTQIVRVLQLGCMDVFSGCYNAWGCKPRIEREDGTMDGLKERYARLLACRVLFQEGYSPRGTEFLAEHGTAAVSEFMEDCMRRYGGMLPNGRPVISVRRSGMTGEEQAVIGLRGKGKGNPRHKAWLEAFHSLIHNELAALPAQTGKNPESRPEYTNPMLAEASETLKAMAVLAQKSPTRAAQMRLRLLNYHTDFLPLLTDIYRELNGRTWHNLEGWDSIHGNRVVEYRTAPTSPHWLTDSDFSALPMESQQLIVQLAAKDNRYINSRKLSPAAVRERELRNSPLLKLPAFAIAEMLGPDFSREVAVKGAYFRPFSDEELSPEPLRFESVITDAEGREVQLRDDTYLLFLNPFDLSVVFVHDAQNRFLGVARRTERADMADPEQIAAAHGRRAHRLAELKKPILKRHAAMVRQHSALLEHNATILEADQLEAAQEDDAADEALRRALKST